MNRQLGRENGFELVHHGADDANPASVMSENFPITFSYLKPEGEK